MIHQWLGTLANARCHMTWSKLTPTNCLGGEMRHPQLHLVHRNPGRRLGAAQHILPPRPPNPRQLLPLLQPPDGARPGGGARQVAHGKSAHCDLRMSSPSTLSISLPPGSFPNSLFALTPLLDGHPTRRWITDGRPYVHGGTRR